MSNHSIFSGLQTSISSELLLEDQLSAKRDFIMSVLSSKNQKLFSETFWNAAWNEIISVWCSLVYPGCSFFTYILMMI